LLESFGFRIENGSLRIFRVFGTEIFLHWSWLVLIMFLPDGLMPYTTPAWHVLEYVALFGMVLLHEFGHVLACRQVGGNAERIVLWPLGGLALVEPPGRPAAFLWTSGLSRASAD
jgi:Zn-dependent protease